MNIWFEAQTYFNIYIIFYVEINFSAMKQQLLLKHEIHHFKVVVVVFGQICKHTVELTLYCNASQDCVWYKSQLNNLRAQAKLNILSLFFMKKRYGIFTSGNIWGEYLEAMLNRLKETHKYENFVTLLASTFFYKSFQTFLFQSAGQFINAERRGGRNF